MKVKEFGTFDHVLINALDELMRKENQYKPFSFHKGGSSFLTLNLTGSAINTITTAFLMTEDDLPEKIDPNKFGYCFKDNKYDISKSFFICKVDKENKVLDSKHYSHYTHFNQE